MTDHHGGTRLRRRTWIVLVGLVCAARAGHAADIPIAALKLIVIDKMVVASTAKLTFVAKDVAIDKGPGTNAANIDARLDVAFDATAGSFVSPSGPEWIVNKSTVAKFVNVAAPGGSSPAKVHLVKPAKLIKVVGRSLGTPALDISSPPSGPVYIVQTVTNDGVTNRHCTQFNTCVHKVIAGGTGFKLVCKGSSVGDPLCTAAPSGSTTTSLPSTTSTTLFGTTTTTSTSTTTSTCPNSCVDATYTNYVSGPGACQDFFNDQAACESAWHCTANSQAAACYYDPGTTECNGCGPNSQEGANGVYCTNVCAADPCSLATTINDALLCGSGPTATTSVTGSTSGPSALGSTCGGGRAPEAVFAWTPACSGNVTVETCGGITDFDTVLYVREATCDLQGELECSASDDCGGSQEQFNFPFTAGQTYYVVVDGAPNESGNFTLTVSITP
jgi:hypothetical protein